VHNCKDACRIMAGAAIRRDTPAKGVKLL
jgi:hypothetical protein